MMKSIALMLVHHRVFIILTMVPQVTSGGWAEFGVDAGIGALVLSRR